jgi:hypothetical protein
MAGTGSPYSEQLQFLRNELEATWRERTQAIAEFGCIIDQVPSMIPAPDGSLRLLQARARMTEAVNAHIRVVKQYVELLTERSMKVVGD